MSGVCRETDREERLHAYEVGILPEEERRRFEIHLLECDACFERAAGFAEPARMLRADPEVRRVVRELAREEVRSAPNGRLREFFSVLEAAPWRRRALRPAMVVFLLLIAAWPAWRAWQGRGASEGPRTLQVLEFYPLRGAAPGEVDLSSGGDLEVRFVLDGAGPERACDVRIVASDGFTVFLRERYHGFNTEGLGTVRAPVSLFRPGVYRLRLEDPDGRRDGPPLQVYSFRVVP